MTPGRAAVGDSGATATLRNLLDAAPAAIVTSARDGSITTWNRAAERLFGWKQDEVIGRPPPYPAPEAQAAETALRQRVLAGNELFRRRGRFQLRDGTEVEMLVSAVPQRDPDGGIVGIISVFEETVAATPSAVRAAPTHPAPAAAARATATADTAVAGPADDLPRGPASMPARQSPAQVGAARSVVPETAGPAPADARRDSVTAERPSQFLARVSHDLRQPLHALSLLTGALERRVKDPGSRELVVDAGAMVRALQDSFDNLVDFARLEEGSVTPRPVIAPAAEMLRPVADDFARDAQRRGISFRYVPCRAAIETDPILLQRLLRQLLGNALRHGAGPAGKIVLGARRKNGCLRLMVADSGTGVPADQATAIFDPFVQLDAGRAAGGLGLGLAIAQKLARLLQTQVGLRSAPGRGSQFWVDVKLAPTP
ncbi:MAG TPA: PAS domain-containing protein [Alphaproteobacteria bacterium]|nr:PAS domain-containing protein [Alphaproteobacteria bacterium]